MAYSDYGSFVYINGQRRPDKEDVGVFDTDESKFPSGARIWANILKNRERNNDDWWNHSQHGVMGDGNVRVACYKQGWPIIYIWEEGADSPTEYDASKIIGIFSWQGKEFVESYEHEGKVVHYIDYEYPETEFEINGYKFKFTSSEKSGSDHYEAEMIEPDGAHWECIYDYGYGAGLTDCEG